MKQITLFWWIILCLIGPTFACTVIDDTGKTIHLSLPAKRIVSLAPDITEVLFSIEAKEAIVGVISGSDYPPAATNIIRIGSYTGIDLEKVVSLHPDLIVTWGQTFSRQLKILQTMGVPVYTTLPHRLEDIAHTINNLGCLSGHTQDAKQVADHFSYQLKQIRAKYQTKKPLTVFYQIGSYSLITINKESWINEVITLCGGRNIFAEAHFIAPEVNWESVVAASPDVIVSDAGNEEWTKRWAKWSIIPAVKNHFLFTLPPDLIERASPRILLGTMQLCELLQKVRKPHSPSHD